MLLYITAEDVLGSDEPLRRGPRPLHTIPSTLAGLYDLGLRHHVRKAAMAWWGSGKLEAVPDWKLDRLAIRVALFGRERLGLAPGTRAVVFGRLGWLWPVVDFAVTGLGAVSVGLEHDLADGSVTDVVARAGARLAFAADAESGARLRRLREEGRLDGVTVVAEGLAEGKGLVPLERLLDLGATLDTAERAQAFRALSRNVGAEAEAIWHAGERGLVRLTHAEAMRSVADMLRARPALEGDVALLEGGRVELRSRLAGAAFVGDGLTTTVLGREGQAAEDVTEARPHKMLVSAEWLGAACDGGGPRWPAGFDRPWARRRTRKRLGERLRWVETGGALVNPALRALKAAGITLYRSEEATIVH